MDGEDGRGLSLIVLIGIGDSRRTPIYVVTRQVSNARNYVPVEREIARRLTTLGAGLATIAASWM